MRFVYLTKIRSDTGMEGHHGKFFVSLYPLMKPDSPSGDMNLNLNSWFTSLTVQICAIYHIPLSSYIQAIKSLT
jgi:hypothetical protein